MINDSLCPPSVPVPVPFLFVFLILASLLAAQFRVLLTHAACNRSSNIGGKNTLRSYVTSSVEIQWSHGLELLLSTYSGSDFLVPSGRFIPRSGQLFSPCRPNNNHLLGASATIKFYEIFAWSFFARFPLPHLRQHGMCGSSAGGKWVAAEASRRCG